MRTLVPLLVALIAPQVAQAQAVFLRGDANVNGELDLADAYVVLNTLFLGSQEILCEDAADADDNGAVEVADSIHTLHYMFVGDVDMPAPFPEAGSDPSADAIGCAVSVSERAAPPIVAINDDAVLEGFTFERVVQRLIDTTPNNGGVTPLIFYDFWWRQAGSACAPTINGFPNACGRADAALEDNDPFTDPTSDVAYVPAAVFNRFDLRRPGDCGEYRVVFGKRSGLTALFDRNLIIFEARVPSPTGDAEGCRPIQEIWDSLESLSPADQRIALEALFFDGVAGVPPLIHGDHFLPATGQVRANTRMDSSEPWALREFDLNTACGGSICVTYLARRTVDRNPFGGLFAASGDQRAAAFQSWFVADAVEALATDPTTYSVDDAYLAASSLMDDTGDYRLHFFGNAAFRASIQTELDRIGSQLSPDDVVARATNESCVGCHNLTAGDDLGGGLFGASSLGAAHVAESGGLSHGLLERFLPGRAAAVRAYLDR